MDISSKLPCPTVLIPHAETPPTPSLHLAQTDDPLLLVLPCVHKPCRPGLRATASRKREKKFFGQ